MSFGQRLKTLRREADISQSDLAEALNVSVQSVSKWECDNNMPDVSLLLPLSSILGVTTDCLLGAGTNEKEDKEKLDKEIEDIWNTFHAGAYEDNAILKGYNARKQFLKKYPLNYDVKLESAGNLEYYLWNSSKRKAYDIPQEEYDALWEEGVKTLKALIKQDKDPSRQIRARFGLIQFYDLKKMWDDAEEIAEAMPKIYEADMKSEALLCISSDRHDFPAALEIAEKLCYDKMDVFLNALWTRARRISIFGNARKEEALAAWDDMIRAARLCREIVGKEDWDKYYEVSLCLIWGLQMASSDNLPLGRIERALDYCEEITDVVEETVKSYGGKSLKEDDYNRYKQLEWALHGCFDMIFEEEDNMLTREERYKKCEERIKAL